MFKSVCAAIDYTCCYHLSSVSALLFWVWSGVFFPSLSILMRLRRGHSSVYPFDSDVLSGLVLSFFRSVLFRFEYFLGGTSSWCTYVQTRPMTRLPETSIIPCICHNLRCIFSRFSSIITTSTFFNRQWLKYVYLVVFIPSISTE